MSPTLTNFLFEAANFLLLAAALGWLLFKPVRRALDSERDRHQQEARETERLQAESAALAKQAHDSRQAAARELEAMRQVELEAAQKEAARIVEEARKVQSEQRKTFEQELRIARDVEAAGAAEAVGRIAAASVRRLLDELDGPSLDQALVRAACDELSGLAASARSRALVECARPLDAASRETLAAALGGSFEERVIPELGAGVRVTTPAGQVEASAVGLARETAAAVRAIAAETEATGA